MKLKDRVAIVTGGSKGIGEAICYAYAQEGAIVIVVNKNLPDLGIEVANKIQQMGGRAEAIACDVADEAAVTDLVNQVIKKYDKVDILVSNVGIWIANPIEKQTLEDWDSVINTNLKSAFLCSRAVVPHMKERAYGKIIFVSSTAAIMGYSGLTPYSASKAGMQGMVKTMVGELAQHNINVNILSPGSADTPGNSTFSKNPEMVELLKKMSPTRTGFILPEDIAKPALFLASDDSKAVHGLDLIVDNGVTSVVI